MGKENLLLSKTDFEDDSVNINCMEKEKIKERNNYYQSLIANGKEAIPLALNAEGLRKINSKEVLEQNILNSDKHLSTLILDYKINREFVLNLLKNYELFDLTEEESKFLIHKYFSNTCINHAQDEDEEVLDLNQKPEITEVESEIEENSEYEEEGMSDDDTQSKKDGSELELDYPSDDENEQKAKTENLNAIETEAVVTEPSIEQQIEKTVFESDKKIEDRNEKTKVVESDITNKDKNDIIKSKPAMYSTMKISSLQSLDVDKFTVKKKNILEKNNMNKEKIEEVKEIKRNISLFFKNALEKRSGIDKKKTIIQFLHKNNFKVTFTASFFDIKDEHGEPLFHQSIIDEWYDAIEQIEEQQKATFECSQLLITVFLYGIEWTAKKMGIEELSTICSEVKDPSNLPKYIEDTKASLSNIIDNNIPNNFITNLLFFIGNVYIKNKAGLGSLL